MSPLDRPNAPWRMASSTSCPMASSSPRSGARSSNPITAMRTLPWPTSSARLQASGSAASLRAYPSRELQSQSSPASRKALEARSRSAVAGETGNGEKPQLPSTCVVTPCLVMGGARGKRGSVKSECVCRSMNPGATTAPSAATTRRAAGRPRRPSSRITPRSTATSPVTAGEPVPSTILAPRTSRSCMAGLHPAARRATTPAPTDQGAAAPVLDHLRSAGWTAQTAAWIRSARPACGSWRLRPPTSPLARLLRGRACGLLAGRFPARVASAGGGSVADDAGVRIRLLGGFELTVGDRPVAADAWRLRKAKTLVKLLALAEGHRMHREALVAVLWHDRDGASAANNLHQTLYVARRVVGGASGGLFGLRDDVVLLSEDKMPWLDTEAFDAACQRARLTRDPQDYRTATELYRGDLLPEDRFEDWAGGPREAFRERRLGLLMEYAEVLSGRGEHAQVVDIAGAVTAADPFHEGAQRTLMRGLAASGRRYEALAAFDRLRDALAEEYAADPEPATRRLYRDLLTGGDTPPEVPPAGGVAVPTRRDAIRMPFRHLGHARDSPRLEQTSFIGRRRELAEIDQALGRTRLLTLTGPGGAGKTRLAYEAAARLVDSYPDGVHVAELASLLRPELVPQMVASLLDVPLPETATAEVTLARQLAERRLLLVLDNCEHLLDACARLADALLRTCPDVVVLATSREPLRVGGEVTWRTPSLALPDLRDLPPLDRLAELESVRLFAERARDAAPGFVLDATTAPAVAEICVRLDGMPLPLELAAALTSALAPAQIASRLDDALRVLGRGSRAAVTRQQTLHATLAWSHDLLEEDERALFRRLAVFAGSMSLEAVEYACGGDGLDVVDLLSRLVDKSLVQAEHAG